MNAQERQSKKQAVKALIKSDLDADWAAELIERLYLTDLEEKTPLPANHLRAEDIDTPAKFIDLFYKVRDMVARLRADTTLATLAREIDTSMLSVMKWRDGRMTRLPNRKSVEKLVAAHNRLVA